MSRIVETKVTRFDGGIANDPRDRRENTCRMVSNFDIYTNPHKLTPYRNSEDGHSAANTMFPQNYLIARRSGATTYGLFAYCRQIALNRVSVQMKALTTGGTNDLDDNTWFEFIDWEGSILGPTFDLFVWYPKTDKIYGGHGNSAIWSCDPKGASGSTVFNNTELSLNYTNLAQGLVHSKDDILYVPYDNKIAKNDGGLWTTEALVLPSNFYITSICEMGNNIAIAMAPLAGARVGQSRVYIWDRNTSVTTLSETIPWEEGTLQILEVIDGYLVGISIAGTTTTSFGPKILFRYLAGNEVLGFRAEKLFTIISTSTSNTTQLPIIKQIREGRLHFMMRVTIDGVRRDGVWSLGKNDAGQWSLSHERTPNNDTAIENGNVSVAAFMYAGDHLFQSYLTATSVFTVSKTSDTASFTATSLYESRTFNAGDSSVYKGLIEATVTTEFLPADGQIILLYQIDENIGTAFWGKIFTNTTNNSISRTGVNIAETSDTVTISIASPAVVTLSNHDLTPGQAISFSTTGALPTGITAGRTYFVIATSIADGSFLFSETRGGSAVNTSGTQSGTHTLSRAAPLPKQYKEIRFRIESTGNAEITGLSFKERFYDKSYDTA